MSRSDIQTKIGCDNCYFTYQAKKGGEIKYIKEINCIDPSSETIQFGDVTTYQFNPDTLAEPEVSSFSELVTWIKGSDCYCQNANTSTEHPIKSYVGRCFVKDPQDQKQTIVLFEAVDRVTGLPCFFLDSELTNLVNINDYEMSNFPGVPNIEAPKNVTGEISGELCGPLTGTFADVLAEALTRPDFVLPDGTQPNGLLKVQIYAEYKGQNCQGTPLTAQGANIGPGGNIASLDGGQSWCQNLPYVDTDCDNFAALCISLDTVLEIPEGAGIGWSVIGANCDTDDTDNSVQ